MNLQLAVPVLRLDEIPETREDLGHNSSAPATFVVHFDFLKEAEFAGAYIRRTGTDVLQMDDLPAAILPPIRRKVLILHQQIIIPNVFLHGCREPGAEGRSRAMRNFNLGPRRERLSSY